MRIKEMLKEFRESGRTIDYEIEESRGARSNEHLWALGSDTQEDANMHEANADRLNAYVELLEMVKRACEGDTAREFDYIDDILESSGDDIEF